MGNLLDGKAVIVAGENPSAELLPRAGFSVIPVNRARAVHEAMRQWKPALLLLGPNLPDTTVPQLVRDLRLDSRTRGASILFVGEAHETHRAEEAELAGANEALLQPLDDLTFLRAVTRLANVAARRSVRLLVRVDLSMKQCAEFCVGFSHNVSASGMLLETDRPLELEQPLTLRFFIPEHAGEIEAEAQVARLQTNTNAGVHFTRIDDGHREAIATFVTAVPDKTRTLSA